MCCVVVNHLVLGKQQCWSTRKRHDCNVKCCDCYLYSSVPQPDHHVWHPHRRFIHSCIANTVGEFIIGRSCHVHVLDVVGLHRVGNNSDLCGTRNVLYCGITRCLWNVLSGH